MKAAPTRVRAASAVLLLACCLAACSSSGEDEPDTPAATSTAPTAATSEVPDLDDDQQVYADALTDQLDSLDDSPAQGESASCLSVHVVDLLGPELIAEAGGVDAFVASAGSFDFSRLGVTRDQGEAIHDAFVACGVDLAADFRAQLAKVADGNTEYAACLDAAWDADAFRDLFVGDMTQGGAEAYSTRFPDSPGAELTRAVLACASGS